MRYLHVLFDLVNVKKKEEIDGSARKYGDYDVGIDKDGISEKVKLIEKP